MIQIIGPEPAYDPWNSHPGHYRTAFVQHPDGILIKEDNFVAAGTIQIRHKWMQVLPVDSVFLDAPNRRVARVGPYPTWGLE